MAERIHEGQSSAPRLSAMPLAWRVFLLNAAVFAAGVLTLALSPATVSHPITVPEALVLVAGLAAILVLNLALIWRSLAPLDRLTGLMRRIDLLSPQERLPATGPPEVRQLVTVFNEMLTRLRVERRTSGRRVLAAQEAERKRVAQELHDELGQSLTAVTLELARVRRLVPAELRDELLEAQEIVRTSLDDVRRIAKQLRPDVLDDLGVVAALTTLGTSFGERTGLRVERRLARVPPLDADTELVLYRVAQESLTNVARHAEASRVELRLERIGDLVCLLVRDDGRGLNGAPAGNGIAGMRERALLVGGELSIEGTPGGGTEVRLEVPQTRPA